MSRLELRGMMGLVASVRPRLGRLTKLLMKNRYDEEQFDDP